MASSQPDPYAILLFKRVLSGQNPMLAQVFLDTAVLERYREQTDISVMRTSTIGRIKGGRTWTLDFGISPDEKSIHVSLGDLVNYLPAAERDHWAQHVLAQPMSQNYVKTRIQPGSCIDDGELHDWWP